MAYLIQHAPAIALCIAFLASVAALVWLHSPIGEATDQPTGETREDTRTGNRDHERTWL